MTLDKLREYFDSVRLVDFEYYPGETGADAPIPICVVMHDLLSGTTTRQWLFGQSQNCPVRFTDRDLLVAYYAAAEISCFIGLRWPIPPRVMDLHAEFRAILNGLSVARSNDEKAAMKANNRYSLLACMQSFDLGSAAVDAQYKTEMRDLALRGGPFTSDERQALIDYCETDVIALGKLLPRMLSQIDMRQALFRGRYVSAVGAIERAGIPIDHDLANRLQVNWEGIVTELIEVGRRQFDVIGRRDIDHAKFANWVEGRGLYDWPQTPTGQYATDSDTLNEWGRRLPEVLALKEYIYAVRNSKLFSQLQIGADGRNRFLLSPFAGKTGRNQPSNTKSVFGPATWVRFLIKPPPGRALIYADWSGQEYGIAAVLSDDRVMQADYFDDDPYLGFAKRIGLAPQEATKKSHPQIRDQLKVAAGLGVLFGASASTVARAGNISEIHAKFLLHRHQRLYNRFWQIRY